jgi:hypothetical protein
MSALAGLFISMFYNAVGFVWNIVDDSQRCTPLEARGSGRSIRPVRPGFMPRFAGLPV